MKDFKQYLEGTMEYGISKEAEIEAIMRKFEKILDTKKQEWLAEEREKIRLIVEEQGAWENRLVVKHLILEKIDKLEELSQPKENKE